MPLKCWSIDCIDSPCPFGITSLLTMCHQGRAVPALKGFPGLYFSLSPPLFPLDALKSDLKQVSRGAGGWEGIGCARARLYGKTPNQRFALGWSPVGMLVSFLLLHHITRLTRAFSQKSSFAVCHLVRCTSPVRHLVRCTSPVCHLR